nr:UbiA family prenyltransferase [Streptomyces sp. SBE_14.2]
MVSVRAWAELLRLPALFTVPGDALAGAATTAVPHNSRTLLAIGSSLCLYEAGMALNDWADREEDAAERPHRPLPSGRVRPAAALTAACALTAGGLALAARAGRPALAVAAPLAATVWAYDLRLKHTPAGPAAMGAARALDLLLGAAATSGRIRPALPSAALLATHTLTVTSVSRHETTGGSTKAPLAALAVTAALSALISRGGAGARGARAAWAIPGDAGGPGSADRGGRTGGAHAGGAVGVEAGPGGRGGAGGADRGGRMGGVYAGGAVGVETGPGGRGGAGGADRGGRMGGVYAGGAVGVETGPGGRGGAGGADRGGRMGGVYAGGAVGVEAGPGGRGGPGGRTGSGGRGPEPGGPGSPGTAHARGTAARGTTAQGTAARGTAARGTAVGPSALLGRALALAYAATTARPHLHAALNPSPPLTQRAVGAGIRATVPLQAALAARSGAAATALFVAALAPLGRRFARRVSIT